MSLPYAILGEYTGSVQSGSILNDKDSGLFYVSQSQDIWFGLSSNDAIEVFQVTFQYQWWESATTDHSGSVVTSS